MDVEIFQTPSKWIINISVHRTISLTQVKINLTNKYLICILSDFLFYSKLKKKKTWGTLVNEAKYTKHNNNTINFTHR